MTEKEKIDFYYDIDLIDIIADEILSKSSSIHWAAHREKLLNWSDDLKRVAKKLYTTSL